MEADSSDSEREQPKKYRGLSKEEAREKRKRCNAQERKRQRAFKDAVKALGRILPGKSMSRHEKGCYAYIIETTIAYICKLTVEANSLNPEAFRHLHGNFEIFLRDRSYNYDTDLASELVDLQDTKDLPVMAALSAPHMNPMSAPSMNPMSAPSMNPMSAPPMNPMSAPSMNPMSAPSMNPMSAPPMKPMPDAPMSQPLETIHQNGQVSYQPQMTCQTTLDPFLGQQNFISDQTIHQQPTVAPPPEHFISSNPSCLWGGWNPTPHSTMLQGHAPGPQMSYPMNVPDQAVLYPGTNHMGPRHPNYGPSLMQPGFSAPSFPPLPHLPALASSLDCPPIFPTPHGHNCFHSVPNTHLPIPAYPTPLANKIMSNDSGYSGMPSSITLNSSTTSEINNNSKSRRRKRSSKFSPYLRDMTLDEIISFTNQPS